MVGVCETVLRDAQAVFIRETRKPVAQACCVSLSRKPVARHFNAVNHSISDIKVCAISPISGGNDSRKRHEKRLIWNHSSPRA